MKNIENYENLIEVLKQALLFYNDKNNYIEDKPTINHDGFTSMIEIDGGTQAKFALGQIDQIRGAHEELESNWEDALIKNTELIDSLKDQKSILDLINELKENK